MDHGFAGYTNAPGDPEAACWCGQTRQRATPKKARDAIELHVTRQALAAGEERARQTGSPEGAG